MVTEEVTCDYPDSAGTANCASDLYTVVSVSGLATGNAVYYPVSFSLTNPPTAQEIPANTLKCASFEDDGSGGETEVEDFWVANSIFITALLCDNSATLSGYDTTVGGTSAVTLTYQLCAPFPTGGYFVLQLPKLNSPYEDFGAPSTLTSMLENLIGVSGVSGTVTAGG